MLVWSTARRDLTPSTNGLSIMQPGKIVLVTAVSGGIGNAIFTSMAPEVKAIVSSSRGAKDDFWKNGEYPGNATHFPADMTREENVERLFKHVIETHGRIDVAINC